MDEIDEMSPLDYKLHAIIPGSKKARSTLAGRFEKHVSRPGQRHPGMVRRVQTAAVFLFFLILLPWTAFSDQDCDQGLVFDPVKGKNSVGPCLEMIEDPAGNMTLKQIMTADPGRPWQPNHYQGIHVGHTASAWWFRFRLDSRGAENLYLEFNKPGLSKIDLYIPVGRPDRPEYLLKKTGDLRPPDSRDLFFRSYLIKLPPEFLSGEYFYIRIQSIVSINTRVTAWSPKALSRQMLFDSTGFGLVYGVLVCMSLYNLTIFFFLRDRTYLIYVLYMTTMLANLMFIYGQMPLFLPLTPETLQTFRWIVLGFSWFWAVLFSLLFLDIKTNAPRFYNPARALLVLAVFMIVSGALGYGRLVNIISNAISPLASLMGFAIAIACIRGGFTPARYYLAAWLLPAIGLVLYSLGGVLVERGPMTVYPFLIGIALEAILLTLALADRIRIMSEEKEALQKREKKLLDLSIKDSLTGLYNRRFLQEKLEDDINGARLNGAPLSLLMLDVDHFKDYNDNHGHQAGDRVLIELAGAMTQNARQEDTAHRYGGEEFMLLLPGASLKDAAAAAERIRRDFASRKFTPSPGLSVSVTVSIGAAQCKDADTPQSLINRADQALYQAKSYGRNQVQTAE